MLFILQLFILQFFYNAAILMVNKAYQ